MPMEKALDSDTLLALRMNSQSLTVEHGHPVRVLVPGWIGAYSIKWVQNIEVSCKNIWVRRNTESYVMMGDAWPAKQYAPSMGMPLTSLNIKSALALPRPAQLDSALHRLHGYARSPGYKIAGVEWSDDNGQTWSAPRFVDTEGMPYRNVEGPTDAPIKMPDGSVVMAVIGYNFDGDVKNRSSVLMRSQDQGETWEHVSVIASDPGGKLGGFLEPGMVRMKSGRLVVAMRNHGRDHAIWTTYSDDDGKTWAPARKSPLIGHPVDLIQIADGRLMATYGTRTPIHATPGGVRASFSSDEGETWDINSEVQIRNDFLNWDAGYPESIQVADGQILTIYYYNLFGKYFVGATSWRP